MKLGKTWSDFFYALWGIDMHIWLGWLKNFSNKDKRQFYEPFNCYWYGFFLLLFIFAMRIENKWKLIEFREKKKFISTLQTVYWCENICSAFTRRITKFYDFAASLINEIKIVLKNNVHILCAFIFLKFPEEKLKFDKLSNWFK